jgi:hypothetical protein
MIDMCDFVVIDTKKLNKYIIEMKEERRKAKQGR